MLGTWLERGGEGVEGVDRSLEGSQLQSPLVLLLLLQLEDMAGASFQTSLPGSGEEKRKVRSSLETGVQGWGTQGHAPTWGMSGRWVPKHQRAGGEAGEHRGGHHLIDARLARELPASESRQGCVRMDRPPGTLYSSPSPPEVPGLPTHSGLHPPQGGLCGGTWMAQGLSGPTMLGASPAGKAPTGVPHPAAPRDAADPSRDHPSSWLEFPWAWHRQRCRQAAKMPLPVPCQGQPSMPAGSTVPEGAGTCILPRDMGMACLGPNSSLRWKKAYK